MKKTLFVILSLGFGSVYALQNVNLDQNSFSCNGIKLTSNTAESTIAANCKNIKYKNDKQVVSGHNAENLRGSNLISEDDPDPTIVNLQKLAFTTDDGTRILCYYKNNNLVKCKGRAPQSATPAK